MLPFALGCTLSPGSIIFGAAAMIARSGETGVAASLLLKHAWEGVHVLCSLVLARTSDFAPSCVVDLLRFVEGLRLLALTPAVHDSPQVHAQLIQGALSLPLVSELMNVWQALRPKLLARHPSLAQCCDCVSARVGAALSEVLRMTVHIMYVRR